MNKTLKKTARYSLYFLAFCLVLVLALPLWIGLVVCPVANSAVSEKTGTTFKLDSFSLNYYVGKMSAGPMQLDNPPGYSEQVAFKVDKVDVALDMSTLFSDTVVIDEIAIDGVFASYVFNEGKSNFSQIGDNCSAGGEDDSCPTDDGGMPEKTESSEAEKGERKVIIRLLTLRNLMVKMGMVTIPLPELKLENIGEKSNGATLGEVAEAIANKVLKSLNSVGDGINALALLLTDGAVSTFDLSTNALDGAGAGLKSTGEELKKAGKALKQRLKLDKAIDGVGGGADKTVDALKNLFK